MPRTACASQKDKVGRLMLLGLWFKRAAILPGVSMLHRLWLKNYKSFVSQEIPLHPLTVFAGANNAGKSNIFDALRFLSAATQVSLVEAFARHRGNPLETVTREVPGSSSHEGIAQHRDPSQMRLPIQGEPEGRKHRFFTLGIDVELTRREQFIAETRRALPPASDTNISVHARVRYEISVEVGSAGPLIKSEELIPLSTKGLPLSEKTRRPFITTNHADRIITVTYQSRSGHPREFKVGYDRTVLSTIDDRLRYPTICALKEELASWRFFSFDSRAIQAPSTTTPSLNIGEAGDRLPTFYGTLQNRHHAEFQAVSRALKRVIPGVEKFEVQPTVDNQYVMLIRDKKGVPHSARIMSDGTLRVLAMLALAYHPEPPALVAFEEPENGVHPRKLKDIVALLRRMVAEERSQVLVNTHSPYLVDKLEPGELVLVDATVKGSRAIALGESTALNRDDLSRLLELKELGEIWFQGDLGGVPDA